MSFSPSDHDTIEEVTSPEAWGLPHKMLVKLVDSFANWLKSGQETLQQIGSLPPPPLALVQFNLDEKDRFRDLRAQKSLNTINPSLEEVRAYFRKEEILRYSIPDRAFCYTAADGKKSIVAPLRRCGGKPTSKARDHFMLKRDRPPHVTILCLVRDAAARLPGSIGTRADVCTLIRDSQFIVEDVSDAQVNQVVSGALDRLHYERDPCVQFDGERKLWKYLHREREEEDFEDDGTSSTKKWKRPRKDAPEQFDQETVTVAYHVPEDQMGFDLCSDLNAEPSCAEDDRAMEPVCDDMRQDVDDDICNATEQANIHHGPSMGWESLDFNPTQENKLLCQENSTNEDFDDDSFGPDRAVGLLSSGLF